jgi:hypothetical protein
MQEAARDDTRVRVYFKAHIDQPARYWNDLLDQSRGMYICFLDDDNEKLPDFLKILSTELDEHPEIDIVTCGMFVIQDGKSSEHHLNTSMSAENLLRDNSTDSGAFMIRRSAFERIGYFPLNIRTGEDWAMMRRAISCLRFKNLDECLTKYYVHAEARMQRKDALGAPVDTEWIRQSSWKHPLGVRVHNPSFDKLTISQQDAVKGISQAIADTSWIQSGDDVDVIIAPFQMDISDIGSIAAQAKTVISIHMEDPYALGTNLERVRAMVAGCKNTWVVTNDEGCFDSYRTIVGEHIICCSSLSIFTQSVPRALPMKDRYTDVAMIGYAYPSRIRFMDEYSKIIDAPKIQLFGDGWAQAGYSSAIPTKHTEDTMQIYGFSKAIVCLHRLHGDCCDGPHEPISINRGYVEGCAGARVFLDTYRPRGSFKDAEVISYSSPVELAEKLKIYLNSPPEIQELESRPLRVRSALDFTYRTRVSRIINSVRSLRFETTIP